MKRLNWIALVASVVSASQARALDMKCTVASRISKKGTVIKLCTGTGPEGILTCMVHVGFDSRSNDLYSESCSLASPDRNSGVYWMCMTGKDAGGKAIRLCTPKTPARFQQVPEMYAVEM